MGPRRFALGCLSARRQPSLLRCTRLLPNGVRLITVLWISIVEWEKIITRVVMPCFLGSWQLEAPSVPAPPADARNPLEHVTVATCWLQHPSTVRSSCHVKKERDIRTGCVNPAPKSRIKSNLALAAGLADGAARPADRRVRVSMSSDGYTYLTFDCYGVVAMEEQKDAEGNDVWLMREKMWVEEVGTGGTHACEVCGEC